MPRISPWLLSGLTAAAVAAAAPAHAAPMLSPKQASTETRFALLALEDLLRDTWPAASSEEAGAVKAAARRVGDARAVRAFIAERERIVHDLSEHVKEVRLGGEHNTELVEMLELYMKFVRERGGRLADDLDKCDAELRDKYAAILRPLYQQAADERAKAAFRIVDSTAQDYLNNPDRDPLDRLFGMLLVGAFEEANIQKDFQDKLNGKRQELADYFDKTKQDYYDKADQLTVSLLDDVKKDFAKRREAATAVAKDLADKMHWKPEETPFVAGDKPDDRVRDPLAEMRWIAAEPIVMDKGESAEADARLAKAKKYMKAAELIPSAKNKAYNFFRSVCYAAAGTEAIQSTALTAGTDGFSALKIGEAPKLALEAWNKYEANSDRDLSGEILHNYAMTLAYNGQALAAYDLLKKHPVFYPPTPTFYYDQARISATAAEAFSNALALNPPRTLTQKSEAIAKWRAILQDSSLSLQKAVWLGYKDFEKAGATRDLKSFREAEQADLGWRQTFKRIVGGP